MSKMKDWDDVAIAQAFHDEYERLAPEFGYETRENTREFNKHSVNARLMIAVCHKLRADGIIRAEQDVRALIAENESLQQKVYALESSEKALRTQLSTKDLLVQSLRVDVERNKVDAECFRWWVHEAAANPCLVATAIAKCVTEDEYRKVICGAMSAKDEAIYAARAATKGGA